VIVFGRHLLILLSIVLMHFSVVYFHCFMYTFVCVFMCCFNVTNKIYTMVLSVFFSVGCDWHRQNIDSVSALVGTTNDRKHRSH